MSTPLLGFVFILHSFIRLSLSTLCCLRELQITVGHWTMGDQNFPCEVMSDKIQTVLGLYVRISIFSNTDYHFDDELKSSFEINYLLSDQNGGIVRHTQPPSQSSSSRNLMWRHPRSSTVNVERNKIRYAIVFGPKHPNVTRWAR